MFVLKLSGIQILLKFDSSIYNLLYELKVPIGIRTSPDNPNKLTNKDKKLS